MRYDFDISNNNSKKVKRLMKKLDKASFMLEYGLFIIAGITVLSFIALMNLGNFTPVTIFKGHWFIAIITSFCIAGFVTSLVNAFINEGGVYKKLYKTLKLPAFVESIDILLPTNGEKKEKIGELNVPEVVIRYNVDTSGEKLALLTPVDDETYKVISMLDTSSKGRKDAVVPSKTLADSIRDIYEPDKLLVLAVCHIYDTKNGYVRKDDIDQRLIAQEAFIEYQVAKEI